MTSKSPVGDISVVTLIRTDTALDHFLKLVLIFSYYFFGTFIMVPNSVPIFGPICFLVLAYSGVVSFCCFLISFLTMVVFTAYLIPISQTGPCNLGPNEVLMFSDDVLIVSY